MSDSELAFERNLFSLAGTWLACRMAAWGGTPCEDDGVTPLAYHQPVTNFRSLAYHLQGCTDYAEEMRLLCVERLKRP